ncbi:AAC(3) family N-acetyltransferase [Cellulomonas sp. SLBN-39]|uniref:AAC(3) family N-acetyltransferase n=1 Tax=Cellulomonas sp. SLBN-39 TaxID=2768446 RepID=UPI00210692C6|nr:AAC(3) family N-acetyltransferase [Cellulomonas sp. SLBN-39]
MGAGSGVRRLEGDVDELGESSGSTVRVMSGMAGRAPCRLVPFRELVDHATRWLPEHRELTRFTDPHRQTTDCR